VTNVNFNVPGNNGIYGSAPAYNGDGGTIELEGCYGNDCHHTAFRIGDCGMSIENCVSYKSGTRGEPQTLGSGKATTAAARPSATPTSSRTVRAAQS